MFLSRALLLFAGALAAVSAADVVTVTPAGVMTVNGVYPSAPAATAVNIGGGTVNAGNSVVTAGVQANYITASSGLTAANITVNRTTQAAATEAVRGDDPRLNNARPALGGDADTVDGKHAVDLVPITQKGAANGVATLDASGKIPTTQMPQVSAARGMQILTTSGTFTVPAGVNTLFVRLWGGGGGGGGGKNFGGSPIPAYSSGGAGGGGAYLQTSFATTPGASISFIAGIGGGVGSTGSGTAGVPGKATSFGTLIANPGEGGGAGGSVSSGQTAPAGLGGAATALTGALALPGMGRTTSKSVFTAGYGEFPGGMGSGGNGFVAPTPGQAGLIIVEW